MKHAMKKHISYLFLLLALTWSGCKKDYLELSTNPNLPVTATPGTLLSGALKVTADILNGNIKSGNPLATTNANYTMYACWMGYLTWSTGYQPNVQLLQYAFTNADYDVWSRLYINLSNYDALTKSTTAPNYLAISKIMTAFNFQALVDNYNDVPYTQAFDGINNLNPKYDKGSDIYDDLLKQLDAAIVLIQQAPATALNPGTADIMYGGNMDNWIKFANTLKLRLAIRQSNVTTKAAALKTAIAATSTLKYIDETNPALVNPGYLNSDANSGQQSPLYLAYGISAAGSSQDYRSRYMANSYSVDFYKNLNDPRLLKVYAKNGDSVIFSLPFGAVGSGKASRLGSGVLKGPGMSATIMSAAEALFLQSEGVARGLISGDAKALYNAGITASFNDDLITSTATQTAYLKQPAVAFPTGGTFEQQLKAIIVQKWAALNPYGAFEAYNEYRRTGYPDDIPLSVYPGTNAPNQVTRIYYPAIEYQTNGANVSAEPAVDIFTSKIFWAK